MSTYHTILDRKAGPAPAYKGGTPYPVPEVEIGLDERSGYFDLHVRQGPLVDGLDTEVCERLTCADLRWMRDRINEILRGMNEQDGSA